MQMQVLEIELAFFLKSRLLKNHKVVWATR